MTVIAKHCPHITVKVVDISQEKIDAWNSDHLPIYEPGLKGLVQASRGRNLFFSTDVAGCINEAEIVFIAVDTNTKNYGTGAGCSYDLTSTEAVTRKIASVATTSKIVVEKSTVPVRTAEKIRAILESNKQRPNMHFRVVSNPEFLAEGQAVDNLEHPSRVLIGRTETADGEEAVQRVAEIYASWVPRERILTTNTWSSELSKLAANAFLAQRISTINALSAVCELSGADVSEVARAVGMDPRIGPAFLQTSVGFGGSCFKKDVLGLVYLCEAYQLNEVAHYFRQIVEMNEHQKARFSKNIIDAMFGTLRGKKITLFGFAFKKNTADIRESPAIDVSRSLLQEHAKVTVYDPKVRLNQIHELGEPWTKLDQVNNVYDSVTSAHAVVVLTEWDEFKTLDWQRVYDNMEKPAFVFDGRNMLDHTQLQRIGFKVHAIGKAYLFGVRTTSLAHFANEVNAH